MNLQKLLPILLAGIIAGCSSTRSASFKEMSASYREVIEQYSNDNILLNVVRSANNMPLSFLDIPSVVGSGSITTLAGLSTSLVSANPSSFLGFYSAGNMQDSSMSTGTVGMSLNNSFTFTQSSLDNSSFMMAFLKDIPIDFVELKGTERLRPKTVEYSLLIESIQLRSQDGNQVVHLINDPMDPSHEKFQDALLLLIESGLRTERRSKKIPISNRMSEAEFNSYSKSWSDAIINNIANGSFGIDKNEKNGKASFQLVKIESKSEMCMNKFSAKNIFGDLFSESAYCANSSKNDLLQANAPSASVSKLTDGQKLRDMNLVINIRSAGNVFDYLGSVMLVQHQDPSRILMIKPSKSGLGNYYPSYQAPSPLFKVYKDRSDGKMAASVIYKGVNYSIADEDDSYSKVVMEYLSTILTISKVPGSIPPSPAVIVR